MMTHRLPNSPSLLIVSKVLGSILTLATAPLIARALGPDGRGITAGITAVVFLVPLLCGFGLPWVVRRRVATAADPHAVIRSAQRLSVLSLIPALLISALAVSTIFSDLSSLEKIVFYLCLSTTPLVVSRNVLISYFVVTKSYTKIAVLTLAQPLFYVGGIFVCFAIGQLAVVGVIAVYGLSIVATYVATIRFNVVRWRGSRVPFGALLRESARAGGAQIAEMSSYRLGLILLLPLAGASALGQYSVATNIAMAPSPVGNALGASSFVHIAKSSDREQSDIAAESIRHSTIVGLLAGALVAAIAPLAVPIIFGNEFRPAIETTLLLSVGTVLVIVNQVLTSSLFAINKGMAVTFSQLSGLVVSVPLLIIFGQKYGANGAALSAVCGYFVTTLFGVSAMPVTIRGLVPRRGDFQSTFRALFRRAPDPVSGKTA
ncbi:MULTISPECIES: oligosaccharide flippase family protein [unclassified Rhodococcus (in: high G+C Gram-positive bacteria)]|uniref:lipopolysaccharide biosynthesis protein n=1 Tax=unclassified Rhodococcus (in: high G+C Gram-positive bacteria) TaxID=192944 RepID=UPI003399679B